MEVTYENLVKELEKLPYFVAVKALAVVDFLAKKGDSIVGDFELCDESCTINYMDKDHPDMLWFYITFVISNPHEHNCTHLKIGGCSDWVDTSNRKAGDIKLSVYSYSYRKTVEFWLDQQETFDVVSFDDVLCRIDSIIHHTNFNEVVEDRATDVQSLEDADVVVDEIDQDSIDDE